MLVTAGADGPGAVTVSVADDGQGMAAEFMLAPLESMPIPHCDSPSLTSAPSRAK